MKADWSRYPNFKKSEFDCKHTGNNGMTHEFMSVLQALRDEYGKPIIITSGYRSPLHPVERAKPNGGGTHTDGIACDIAIKDGAELYELLELAFKFGFTGIGVGNRPGHKMLHLDIRETKPVVWSY